jgi:flagellar assembly factor FliW
MSQTESTALSTAASPSPAPGNPDEQSVVELPLGLLGFEQYKRFVLLASPAEEPFLWLQSVEDPTLSFLVLSPFVVLPDYRPEIGNEDAGFLGLESPRDTLVLNIVTVRGEQQATINLKGPVVVNTRTMRAKQIVPANATAYSVAHPLPVQAA